jgi:MFS family permease
MALVGIFSSGVTSGCIEIVVPQLITKYNGGLPVLESNLIWTLGPLAFTLVAPLAGHLIDKLGAATMFLTAQFLIALFYPLYFLMDSSLVGIGSIVMTSFALEAIMELSAYALIAQIVDSTKLVNALPVGYSLNEVSIQGGFAVGNIIGVLLAEWMGLLGVGLIMGSVNGFLAIAAVVFHTSTRVHANHCPHQGNTCNSEDLMSDTNRFQHENTHKMSSFL